MLSSYGENGLLHQKGLPTVSHIASQLHISSRYLSDLLKQETGKTALDHIHIFLIGEAKNLLMGTDNTIAETAYQLGFENPLYFSRLFKKQTGVTPNEYRARSLNRQRYKPRLETGDFRCTRQIASRKRFESKAAHQFWYPGTSSVISSIKRCHISKISGLNFAI